MSKPKPPKRRQRPGTAVIQRAAAIRHAAPRPHAPPTAAAPHDHDSVKGQLGHLGRELVSLLTVAFWLGAIFGLSVLAEKAAEYMRERHMPSWKVTVFEVTDDFLLVVDVVLLVVYVGRAAYRNIKREFQ